MDIFPKSYHAHGLERGLGDQEAYRGRGERLCPGRRLRAGHDVRHHHRRRERRVRTAGDPARDDPRGWGHPEANQDRRKVAGDGVGSHGIEI